MWLLVVMGVSLVTGLIAGPLLARAAERQSVPLVEARRRRRAARIAAHALQNRVAPAEPEDAEDLSESAHLN